MRVRSNHAGGFGNPRVLFTLRESRRGRLEAGGLQFRCSVDVKFSKIGARSSPKSLPEAPRGIKNRCQEHQEQQVGSPGPSWAPILTLGGTIWALLGLKLELRGLILLPRWIVLGAPGLHFEGPGAPRGSILSILHPNCRMYDNHGKT